MKINKLLYFACISACGLFTACDEENPVDQEQYFKQIYLVGALDIVKAFDIPYNDTPQSTYVSVATSGSLNIDGDVEVTLTHSDEMIDWYNNKYMIDAPVKYQKLADQYYNIPSLTTVIKTGEVYSRLPFTVNTNDLHCDSLYALTFKIESVSDYQMHPEDTVLIMNLNFVNDYSGTYQMTAVKYLLDSEGNETAPTSINVQRTVKAVNKNSVRFINEAVTEPTTNTGKEDYFNSIDNNGVVFTHEGERSFLVSSWKNLNILSGTATFNDNRFNFSYDYVSGSFTFRLTGTLTK